MARQIGKNLSLFTVGSGAYVGLIRTCEIERSFDTQENRALQDAYHYNVPIIEDWRLTFTIAADTTLAYSTNSKDAMTYLMGLVGTVMAFTVETSDTGTSYAGTGVLVRGTHSIPDGLQEGSFEITPQSALVPTQAS